MNGKARAICDALRLSPHPEGGWYRETWRADPAERGGGSRSDGTAIHFLLAAGEHSHWHRVDASEIWCWHSGDPLALSMADTDGQDARTIILGGTIMAGQRPQTIIPAHHWQSAELAGGSAGYALVSCIVIPGFEFAGFELAPKGWRPGAI